MAGETGAQKYKVHLPGNLSSVSGTHWRDVVASNYKLSTPTMRQEAHAGEWPRQENGLQVYKAAERKR